MNRERTSDLAALVAMGAADENERAEFKALLASDPNASAELAVWEATIAPLAESLEPVAPPAGGLEALRAAIATESRATEAPAPFSVANPEYAQARPEDGRGRADIISLASRRQKRILSSGLALVMAAAAAFLFLWLRERDRATTATDEVAAVRADRDSAIEAVQKDAQVEIDRLAKDLASSSLRLKTLAARFDPLRSPELELATLSAKDGGFAHVFADGKKGGKRQWLIFADSLPEITADQDYQLWFVPPATVNGGKPVSAGLLRRDEEGVMSATLDVPAELAGTKLRPAISLEPHGGSPQPTAVKLIGEPI